MPGLECFIGDVEGLLEGEFEGVLISGKFPSGPNLQAARFQQ